MKPSSSSTPQLLNLHRTPFSNYVRMHTHSLVPRPQITAFGLGMRLAHTISASRSSQSLPGPGGRPEEGTQHY